MLDAKIRELKREVEPREVEIAALKGQVGTVNAELTTYHAANAALDARIGALRADIEALGAASAAARAALQANDARARAFEVALYTEVQGAASTDEWTAAAARLVKAHAAPGGAPDSNVDLDAIVESLRQQRHLERRIVELRADGAAAGRGAREDASVALVSENAAVISQIASITATVDKMRAETKALQLRAQLKATKRAAAGGEARGEARRQ